MMTMMVQYRVKKSKVPTVKKAIAQFVDAIERHEPGTLSYEAFQLEDDVSFLHVMSFQNVRSQKVHQGTPQLKVFVGTLYPCCVIEPVFTTIAPVAATSKKR